MRILLDECVDARLAPFVAGHETRTVHDMGWQGITNGKLLAMAAGQFDVFVTVDRNLSFQQHLPNFAIAVILMHCRTNRLEDLRTLLPQLAVAMSSVVAGAVTHVGPLTTASSAT